MYVGAVRDRAEIVHRLQGFRRRLDRVMAHGLELRRQRLDHALEKYAFKSLRDLFAVWRRAVAEHVARLRQEVGRLLHDLRRRLDAAGGAYGLREWPRELAARRATVADERARLDQAVATRLAALDVRVRGFADRLRALSPRLVLERGYCLVRGPDGTLLRDVRGVGVGDPVQVELARGELDARIEAVRVGEDHGE